MSSLSPTPTHMQSLIESPNYNNNFNFNSTYNSSVNIEYERRRSAGELNELVVTNSVNKWHRDAANG